jgi:hypothetical protein
MKTIPYWTGLFLADYTLFLVPTFLFAVLVSAIHLEAFSDSILAFIITMLGFGFAIISLTYLIASFFNEQDIAIRWNIAVQLIIGNLLPLVIMIIFAGATYNPVI